MLLQITHPPSPKDHNAKQNSRRLTQRGEMLQLMQGCAEQAMHTLWTNTQTMVCKATNQQHSDNTRNINCITPVTLSRALNLPMAASFMPTASTPRLTGPIRSVVPFRLLKKPKAHKTHQKREQYSTLLKAVWMTTVHVGSNHAGLAAQEEQAQSQACSGAGQPPQMYPCAGLRMRQ